MDALQYLAGYIIKNLLQKATRWNPDAKIIETLTSFIDANYSSQTLVTAQSRGGLTAVNEEAQRLFIAAVKSFRAALVSKCLRPINIVEEAELASRDNIVVSYYNSIIENANIEINEETKIKILDMILNLYFRVRTNSLTKDLKYKRINEKVYVKIKSRKWNFFKNFIEVNCYTRTYWKTRPNSVSRSMREHTSGFFWNSHGWCRIFRRIFWYHRLLPKNFFCRVIWDLGHFFDFGFWPVTRKRLILETWFRLWGPLFFNFLQDGLFFFFLQIFWKKGAWPSPYFLVLGRGQINQNTFF